MDRKKTIYKEKLNKAILSFISKDILYLHKNYKRQRRYKTLKSIYPIMRRYFLRKDYKIFDGEREIPIRVFSNNGKGKNTIIYFHGGGWCTESIDSYNNICLSLARATNNIVVSVGYRLSPEHPFPAGFNDCYYATKVLHQKQKEVKLPGKFILMGDSAGANLAAAVSQKARDTGEFMPEYQILIYPALYWDYSVDSPFPSVHENGEDFILTRQRICYYTHLYRGGKDCSKNPYFAPLVAEDFSNQPKTLLIVAEYDPLRDEGKAYADKLEEAGNLVKFYCMKRAIHGFINLGSVNKSVRKTYKLVNVFLNDYEREVACIKDKI